MYKILCFSLERGIQLRVRRKRSLGLEYWHHGVYVGNGYVIEHKAIGLRKIPYQEFVGKSQEVQTVRHIDSGYSLETCARRAEEQLGKRFNWFYNIVSNNCEHFANWVCTGVKFLKQNIPTWAFFTAPIVDTACAFAKAGYDALRAVRSSLGCT